MSHSLNKIWIHAIWATKERQSLIQVNVETKIHQYMVEQFKEYGCYSKIINGMTDHVHCLFMLNQSKALADVIKYVKGGTSHWINEQDLIKEKFSWQTGYAGYSVSESQLHKVYCYIKNQKMHHIKKSFQNEYDDFLRLHGLMNDGLNDTTTGNG